MNNMVPLSDSQRPFFIILRNPFFNELDATGNLMRLKMACMHGPKEIDWIKK